MRVIFMGTPDFAVPTLQKIIDQGHEVIAVVTQPDKARGRGKSVTFSPVKEKALEYWKKADSMENKEEDGATPRTEAELKRLKRKIALKKYIE